MCNPRVRPPSSLLYTCITFLPQSAAFLRHRPPTRSRNHYVETPAHLQKDWRSCCIKMYVKHFWEQNWFVPFLYWYAAPVSACLMWILSLALSFCVKAAAYCTTEKPGDQMTHRVVCKMKVFIFFIWYCVLNSAYMQCNKLLQSDRSMRRIIFQIHWCRLFKLQSH